MSTRIAVGISHEDAGVDSFSEAAARAALALGGAPCDLALVFAGARSIEHAEAGLEAVHERLRPATVLGCGAQGVIGSGRELEDGGVTVWAASLGAGSAEPFHVRAEPLEGGLALAGVPDAHGADAALVLADPYTFPAEPLLAALADTRPELPVVGGIASAGGAGSAIFGPGGTVPEGAVGVLLRDTAVRTCVSQGARPIGPEMTITAAEENVVEELASQPALERLREVVSQLDPSEQRLAAQGLLIGLVTATGKPDYGPGDFLVRGIGGADEETGALRVGARVRVGQTVRLHVRDAASAHEDLAEALAREAAALGHPPAGALLFTCNGRGMGMFGEPHHDARAVHEAFGGAASGGFFCAGEIGPLGGRSFLHGVTATVAAFPGERG